ncbi:MAG: two-component regulator propeller domain-containing protein [candidate division Zixibacteria bacterium]
MKTRGLILIIILYGCAINAQEWRSYTNSDNVRQIAVDEDVIWGATSGGVVAISSLTGDLFKLTNTDGLGGIDFNCVEIDSAGHVWLGSRDGWLSVYRSSDDIINYPVKDSSGFFAREVEIFDLFDDGERLWVANDLGVSKFLKYSNGGEIKDTARRLGDIPDEEDVMSLAVIGDYLWAGTTRGIAFIDKDNQNIQYFGFWRSFGEGDNGLSNANIKSITAFHDTVVVGTGDGVFKLVDSPDTLWQSMGLTGRTINSLFMDESSLLAATTSGLFRYDGLSWTGITTSGLLHSNVSAIAADSSGKMWVGTPSGGIAGFSDTVWTRYSIPGPASNFIKAIAIDSFGAVWMTHDLKGLSVLRDTVWTILNSDNSGLDDNAAVSITVGGDGEIWVSNYGTGLYNYDHTSWYHWTSDNSPMWGVPGAHYYWAATAVQVDIGGNVWVSSLDADSGLIMGVYGPADSLWHIYQTGPNSVFENNVWSLLTQGNTIWVGMSEGLHRLDFGGTPFNESDDNWQGYIIREFVGDMGLDRFGDLWFGSLTGLFQVSSSSGVARRVELPAELAGRVNTVAADAVGNIWVGTVNGLGIYRSDVSEWRAIYNTSNSPLLNNEVTEIAIDITSGFAYIGTLGGLSIFDSGFEAPDIEQIEAYPNPVIVSEGHNSVYFKRIPPDANIYIYTVAGDLVFELAGDKWDLINSKGEPIAGGIYIFLVESDGITGTGKFAVIK